jgi:ribosome-associated translation inhibitor RaiA
MSEHDDRATVESSLRLNGGIDAKERDRIVAAWGSLTKRLQSFDRDAVELELSVKERSTPSQRMVLEARIARGGRFLVTSEEADFNKALTEVRDDLMRQLNSAKNRTEPRNRRSLRETIREHE